MSTGNLRAWFPYPCNPDNCGDAQMGKVAITNVQYVDHPPSKPPSAPGSVAATASTDGTGAVTVRWAAPTDLGGAQRDLHGHRGLAERRDAPTAAADTTGLEHTFTGLTLGRAYTFTVTAR